MTTRRRFLAAAAASLLAAPAVAAAQPDPSGIEFVTVSDPGNPAATSLLGALEFSGNDRKSGLRALRVGVMVAVAMTKLLNR